MSCEAVTGRGGKIVNIDYRMNETVSGHPDEWPPIRPEPMPRLLRASRLSGFVNGQVNKEFLDKYAVGYDDDTMPESASTEQVVAKDLCYGHWP